MQKLTLCPRIYTFACYEASSSFESDRFSNFTTSDMESDTDTGLLVVDCYTAEEAHELMQVEHRIARLERLAMRKAESQKRNPHKQGRERKSYQDYLDKLG